MGRNDRTSVTLSTHSFYRPPSGHHRAVFGAKQASERVRNLAKRGRGKINGSEDQSTTRPKSLKRNMYRSVSV
ncbi:hypothetical protein BOTBODRAFT_370020 [Botryobasidium botryosum FD-172 SS1]|uniref:Uncharacterized protein n=1 Tax=Botryobasidium botryosum (strain FD-172 SS1) TaxID=930990 RepID=A0A067MNR2_BOTB1|nr:hypothetical protein BOTBODRAFT_370020 [Botryobasidium botryosum FD-172 SS1]